MMKTAAILFTIGEFLFLNLAFLAYRFDFAKDLLSQISRIGMASFYIGGIILLLTLLIQRMQRPNQDFSGDLLIVVIGLLIPPVGLYVHALIFGL